MSKNTFAFCALTAAVALALSAPASAETVRELVMAPGKGVSFYMGSKHGITTFLSEGGLCKLTVALGDNPDMEGMNPGASTKMVTAIVPGHTTRLETTEGQALLFTCQGAAESVKLTMPEQAELKSPSGQ